MSLEARWLVAALGAQAFWEVPSGLPWALYFHAAPGVAGAWTELRGGGREHILFGCPEKPRNSWLRLLEAPKPPRHSSATLALERLIFARRINSIAVADAALEKTLRRGASVHQIQRWEVRRPGEDEADFLRRVLLP